MKKHILSLITVLGLITTLSVFADNKTDQIAKQVKELEARVNSLDDLSTTLAAEDKVNAWLTLSGYIEMSAGTISIEDDNDSDDAEATFMNVGIVEFVFDFDFSDQLSASIHVTSEADVDGPDFEPFENYSASLGPLFIEEAWLKWTFASVEGLSLRAGIMDYGPGLEATEAVDLYQYSTAVITGFLPAYAQGLQLAYETEKFSVTLSLVDSFGSTAGIGGTPAIDGNIDEFGFMISGSVKIGENGTLAAAFGTEESTFFDIWATYVMGQFEVAAEYVQWETEGDGPFDEQDWMGFILRGTWSINDKWSVTVRYDWAEDDENDIETNQFIISPAVTVSENLLILAEFGVLTEEDAAGDEIETTIFVIEAFLTF